jgi:signal transduction histidine kinase
MCLKRCGKTKSSSWTAAKLAREKELGQLRSKFVSMVSHEFRTPLGIIQSSAEILEDYLDQLEPAERQDHLQSIRNNTRRMAGIMEEALLVGSFDAGKMEFKPAAFDKSQQYGNCIRPTHRLGQFHS